MPKKKISPKSQFYRFFKLTQKHRLVTHLRPEDGELVDFYSTSFTMDGVEVNAILHLYDEYMLYDFFAEKAEKVFEDGIIGSQVQEDQLFIDRWAEKGIEGFLFDAIESFEGFCVLFYPKNPSVLEKSGQLWYPPLLRNFLECILFNSEIQPPQWMKEDDIETAININTHLNIDVKNLNPPHRRKK